MYTGNHDVVDKELFAVLFEASQFYQVCAVMVYAWYVESSGQVAGECITKVEEFMDDAFLPGVIDLCASYNSSGLLVCKMILLGYCAGASL